ncbi:MAG: hypothetical protein LC808_10075 [Actinobacteria bacterium]|nr:hypothetical protein [Actinomycetota bacterium]
MSAIPLLTGAVAFLGWRGTGLGQEVDEARIDASIQRHRLSGLTADLERTRDEFERSESRLADAQRKLRRLRQRYVGRQPCSRWQGPHLWLIPSTGPVGTRVQFVGDCFVERFNDTSEDAKAGYGIFLIRQLADRHPSGECEQIVGGSPFDITISNGRAVGYFTVQGQGSCFQHDEGPFPVVPSVYEVGIGCHACSTNATFRVTP